MGGALKCMQAGANPFNPWDIISGELLLSHAFASRNILLIANFILRE
jgi:hypothetical protein